MFSFKVFVYFYFTEVFFVSLNSCRNIFYSFLMHIQGNDMDSYLPLKEVV